MEENQRTCYIHIGTHKTGSSAIQRVLMENREKLARRGILVPLLGFETDFMLGGHVNIPRELSGDVLFNPKFGTLVKLYQTLCDTPCSTAVVTSELFEFLWSKPQSVQRLASWIAKSGFTAKIIVYLRSRSRYIESLYSQMLRHGFDCPFDEYLGDILTHGRFESTDGFLKFQFEYAKIVAPFAEAFGAENIIAKRYGQKRGREFLKDFLDTVGCPDEARAEFEIRPVENETLTFNRALNLLFQNACTYAGATGPSPAELLHSLYGSDTAFADKGFSVMALRDTANLSTRFARDRVELAQRYGIEVPLLEPISDLANREKQRHVLREAAASWGLPEYRKRCRVRSRAGMMPRNLVEPAANLRAATECRS